MNERPVRTYDKEFKLNAVILYLNSGRSYKEIGDELGIPSNTLWGWVISYKKDGEEAFPGKGYVKPFDDEIKQLRKDLAIAREERDI